ncbi:MAG: hypothetical protein HOU81_17575 [Hamadaea sp.]|uniref:hypothetical protein n=1 Tax=Hamadaea sp. TaxID=2024425 RepID=UPI0017BC06E2|nr:hypothetical protein [Hamadaea sp.]NUR72631.1 hypothetical protein [Hamadaea sp.]NUT23074.1 hypothetical protein [Hamadaea sp.]
MDAGTRPRPLDVMPGRKEIRPPQVVKFHPRVDDDLLTGFDGEHQPGELRGFFAITIAVSLLAWDVAFALGAYHTVFYYRLLEIFVLSAVLLLGALALRRHLSVHPWMLAILALPVIWLAWRLIVPVGGRWARTYRVIDICLIALIMVTLPVTLWAVARILAPDYFALSTLRLRLVSVAIVVVVGIAGFLTGQFNNHVVTCQDFVVAGDDQPGNCRVRPTTSPRP